MSDITEYTAEIEGIFIRFFITDPSLFVRCLGIINSEHYGDVKNRKVVHFLCEYAKEYNGLPTIEQIDAITSVKLQKLEECGEAECDWFLDEYEKFARYKEISDAIFTAPDLLDQHRYGEVESMVKNAVSVGLVKDLGLNYFADPKARLDEVANTRGAISTGWRDLDEKLYGGVNRGEISIFAGQSGAGKSVFLQNMAVNWVEMGLNVIYITLELSENLCAMRIDAMITDHGTRDVLKNREDVNLQLKAYNKKHGGTLQIKQMKNGCTANDVKAYVKEYEIQTGIKVDALILDYLDLFMPTNAKISPENLFVKDKYVTENLRDLAVELDTLMATASQLNRGSHEELEFTHANIAGGMSKINTADNVFGIFTTPTMKEGGRYQLQFMKTRSSAGVGSKIDLGFNVKSLRIHDLEDDQKGALHTNTTGILNNLQKDPSVASTGGGDVSATDGDNNAPPPTQKLDDFSALQSIIKKLN